jgi:hypothetical protein
MTKKQATADHLRRLHLLIDSWFDKAEEDGDDAKARTVAMLVGEARKIAKLEADQNEDLTLDRVLEWHRSLSAAERQKAVRALQVNLDKKASGLA